MCHRCFAPPSAAPSLKRSAFVAGASAAFASLAMPRMATASSAYTLWLQRLDTGESIAAPFTLDGKSIYFRGYADLCRVLRDDHVPVRQGWVQIPIRTVEMLWDVQQYLAEANIVAPIVVHSGYRTPQTNADTEGAAWMSLHMFGKAVDFHVPGVALDDLAAICYSCPAAGGVGYYPDGWVHVDTGPRRYWTG